MRILLTGGAGFVGSSLAKYFKARQPDTDITVFDNLHRRGSELNVAEFQRLGISFVHGDIRNPEDFAAINGSFDLLVEASAEPSVHAGTEGSPDYVVHTNLSGTFNCLKFARRHCGSLIFLSTSRVYSIDPLRRLGLDETEARFELSEKQDQPGVSYAGVSEAFSTAGARSFYGATKLASEILLQEFVAAYDMTAVIYRCGVIAGPGQFGKIDQGVYTLWLANHYFGRPLQYTGFGGKGKQVRDLLHPDDLAALVWTHASRLSTHNGQVFNVGGGRSRSISLIELTRMCCEITGRTMDIGSRSDTAAVDIPVYISDIRSIREATDWQPVKSVETIMREIYEWIRQNEAQLKHIL